MKSTTTQRAGRRAEQAGPGRITDALRAAMKDSGLSAYRIAADSGVNIAAVLRFLSGERSLTLASVDRIAEALDLELVPRKR